MRSLSIGVNDAGQRLDKFLMKHFNSLPQSLIYKYLRKNRIKVNGRKAKQDYKLCIGDILDMYLNDEMFSDTKPEKEFRPVETHIDILYEDENILIINKRTGVLAHSDSGREENTLAYQLKSYLFEKGEYDPQNENSFAPALCNRIDRNTQGLVIGAKNASTLRFFNEKIKTKEIKKYYLCLAKGRFEKESETLVSYMVKDSGKNLVKTYDTQIEGSKQAVTFYRVLKETKEISMLEIELITGRSHQIRSQLAHLGHPLLGDVKYGGERKYRLAGQALCSYKIKFEFENAPTQFEYLKNKEFSLPITQIDFFKKTSCFT